MNDKEILIALGGPAKVAALLGLDKSKGGVQRVHNWLSRGIPAKEKLARPDLFIPPKPKRAKKEKLRRNACAT